LLRISYKKGGFRFGSEPVEDKNGKKENSSLEISEKIISGNYV